MMPYISVFKLRNGYSGYVLTQSATPQEANTQAYAKLTEEFKTARVEVLHTMPQHTPLAVPAPTIVITNKGFTLEQGLRAQADDVMRWKNVLNRRAYALLQVEVQHRNAQLRPEVHNGLSVWRGYPMTEWVMGFKMLPPVNETDVEEITQQAVEQIKNLTTRDGHDVRTHDTYLHIGKIVRAAVLVSHETP